VTAQPAASRRRAGSMDVETVSACIDFNILANIM
jgi:hypothetical protein